MTGVIWDLLIIAGTIAAGVWRASRGEAWWALTMGFLTGALVIFAWLRASEDRWRD